MTDITEGLGGAEEGETGLTVSAVVDIACKMYLGRSGLGGAGRQPRLIDCHTCI